MTQGGDAVRTSERGADDLEGTVRIRLGDNLFRPHDDNTATRPGSVHRDVTENAGGRGVLSDGVDDDGVPHEFGDPARTRNPNQAMPAGWLLDLADLDAETIDGTWWPHIERLARRRPLLLHLADGECRQWQPWHRLRFWRSGR